MGQRLRAFRFERPATPAEAIEIFDAAPNPIYLAGGTALIPAWRTGERAQSSTVISLAAIVDAGVDRGDGTLGIGAGAPVARLLSTLRPGGADALTDAATWFATTQIRERATVGGNVALASPRSDLTPALAAMEAVVRFASRDGAGEVAVEHLFEKPGALALPDGAILLRFELPVARPAGIGSAYRRLTTSGVVGGGVLSVAASVALDADGRVRRCRATLGTGVPLPTTVEVHADGRGADEVIAAVVDALREATETVSDLVASAAYRREMIPVAVTRAFAVARERAGEGL